MNIKRIIAATAVAGVASLGFAATANAYESPTTVPGLAGKDGKVVNHYTTEDGGCDVLVNTLGDFGGDPYLNDGQMLNVVQCPDGSVVTYHIFHESHPAYDLDRMTPYWGSWAYTETVNKAGR